MSVILHGDVIDKLKEIETGTVQCVVTSPPYWGLRDYETGTWDGGDENCNHFQDNKITEACITGHKAMKHVGVGNGIYKDICKKCGAKRIDQQLGLEETPEEYVEKMVDVFREIKRVLKKDGTVWLNLGDSYNSTDSGKNPGGFQGKRMKNNENMNKAYTRHGSTKKGNIKGLKPKDLIGIPWRVAFALQSDGWYLRQDIIWHKPNPMPESVKDRCTKSHEYIFLLTKSAKYYYNIDAIREPHQTNSVNKMRDRSMESYNNSYIKDRFSKGKRPQGHENGRNKRSVWSINTKPYKEAHFAVFPPKLPELCIKAGSAEGDIILDPFFGSGTTGYVAQRLYRKWLGIELNPEYIKIANKRFVQQELFV